MACSVAELSPFGLCNFGHFRDNVTHTSGSGSLLETEVSYLLKVAIALSAAVEGTASRATHEPHNHQNHNNCSDHTHT
jgi:hypothetical protein